MAKLEQLYKIGVRKFDILNDDFGGGNNDMVVTVLNRLNEDLKRKVASRLHTVHRVITRHGQVMVRS